MCVRRFHFKATFPRATAAVSKVKSCSSCLVRYEARYTAVEEATSQTHLHRRHVDPKRADDGHLPFCDECGKLASRCQCPPAASEPILDDAAENAAVSVNDSIVIISDKKDVVSHPVDAQNVVRTDSESQSFPTHALTATTQNSPSDVHSAAAICGGKIPHRVSHLTAMIRSDWRFVVPVSCGRTRISSAFRRW